MLKMLRTQRFLAFFIFAQKFFLKISVTFLKFRVLTF